MLHFEPFMVGFEPCTLRFDARTHGLDVPLHRCSPRSCWSLGCGARLLDLATRLAMPSLRWLTTTLASRRTNMPLAFSRIRYRESEDSMEAHELIEQTHEASEKSEGHGHGGGHGKNMSKFIGMTMAVMGVLLALCSALVGSARTSLVTTMVKQTNSSLEYESLSN